MCPQQRDERTPYGMRAIGALDSIEEHFPGLSGKGGLVGVDEEKQERSDSTDQQQSPALMAEVEASLEPRTLRHVVGQQHHPAGHRRPAIAARVNEVVDRLLVALDGLVV